MSAARICFAAAIVLIPFRDSVLLAARPVPAVNSGFTDLHAYPADCAVLLMLGFWIVSLLSIPRRLNPGPKSIWVPLAGLTLIAWVSAIVSLDPVLSVYHAIRFMILFWFYVFVVSELRAAGWVLVPVGIQLMGQSLVALAQFIGQRSVGLQWLGEYSLDPAQSGTSIVAAGGARLLRAYGLTDHPNILGGCLAFGLILLASVYLQRRLRWAAMAAMVPAGAALLATFSRSAWIAFLLGTLLVWIVDMIQQHRDALRRWAWLASASAALVAGFVAAYGGFLGVRLGAGNSFNTPSVEQQSIGERILLIQPAVSMIKSHPLLGVGLGAAPEALRVYQPDWPVSFEPPHVVLLDAAVETGLLGAACYLALVISPWAMYFSHRGYLGAHPLVTCIMALLLALTVVGLLDYYPWASSAGRLWQWLAWGLWASNSVPRKQLGLVTNVLPAA
ncbi:MAG TPA: O-antigen ligase family protein [Anaerolineales bacterium]